MAELVDRLAGLDEGLVVVGQLAELADNELVVESYWEALDLTAADGQV